MPLNIFKAFKVLFFIQATLINKSTASKELSIKDSPDASDLMHNPYALMAQPGFCALESADHFLMEKCWAVADPHPQSGNLEILRKKLATASELISIPETSQALSIAVAKVTIRINQAWHLKIMSTPSSSQLLIALEKEIAQIRALLSQAIHPKLLLDILLDSDFSIELIAPDAGVSYYSPITRTVYIRSSTHESNKQKLAILCNELHHVAVHFANLRRQGLFPPMKVLASMQIVSPFLHDSSQKADYTWQVDLKSYHAHKAALEAGFERIKNFKNLLDQFSLFNPNIFLDELGKKTLNKYLDAVRNYRPMFYKEYSSLEQNDGTTLDHNSKSNNIRERATAFIMDMEKYKKLIYRGSYRNLPLSEKELELSSFLQEVDPNILQVFFPEWCDYFSQYHQVENYCLISK